MKTNNLIFLSLIGRALSIISLVLWGVEIITWASNGLINWLAFGFLLSTAIIWKICYISGEKKTGKFATTFFIFSGICILHFLILN